jgi:cell division initiation protein
MVDEKILFDEEEKPERELKISPADIMQKEFSIRFRGYDISQVDDFLEETAREYNQVVEEHARFNKEVRALRKELAEYRENESKLYDALAAAKKIGSDMQENAHKEASLIISGAQLDADKIIADVRQQCAVLQQEINTMVQKRAQFEASLKAILDNYLSMLGGGCDNVKLQNPNNK